MIHFQDLTSRVARRNNYTEINTQAHTHTQMHRDNVKTCNGSEE